VTASVMVFTRDLRLADNPALAAAARAPAMVPLFVLDETILRRASGHANRHQPSPDLQPDAAGQAL
jgi:deoxyribodipyrimidine photo-lyase